MTWNPRAELYFALSETYKEPSPEFASEVAAGALCELIREGFTALGIEEELGGLRIPEDPEKALQHLQSARGIPYAAVLRAATPSLAMSPHP